MPSGAKTTTIPISQHLFLKVIVVLAVLIPLIYHPGLYDFTLIPKRFVVQLGICFIAVLWAIDLSQNRITFQISPLYLPIFAYLFFSILSITQATNPVAGLMALSHLITFAILYLLVIHLFQIPNLTQLTRMLSVVGIGVSILGILEGLGFHFDWFPISNGRPSATFGYRNFAAAYLIMAIPFTLCHTWQSKTTKDFFLGLISTNMMSTFLIYTRTRGAWLGLLSATLFIGIVYWITSRRTHQKFPSAPILGQKKYQRLALVVCAFFITLMFISPQTTGRQTRSIDEKKLAITDALTLTSNPQSIQVRLNLWRHTLEMIQHHPILGVGIGNWPYIYAKYDKGDLLRADQEPQRPHNDLLWIAAETGILGLLSFIGILLVAGHLYWRTLTQSKHTEHILYGTCIAISLLAMLGHGLVSFPRELIETSYLFYIGLGLLTLLAPKAITPSHRLPKPLMYLSPALMCVMVIFTYRQVQFEKYYMEARQYHLGQDYHTTLQKASVARQWGPFNHQIFLLLGNGYQGSGLMQQAEAAYKAGLDYHPNSIQILGALGTHAAYQNQLDVAEKYYQHVLELYPDYHHMYNNLGGIYQKRGQLDLAIAEYEKALARDPYYTDAYRNLGLAYLEQGQAEKAIETYQKALNHTFNEPVLYHELGDAYYQLKPQTSQTLTLAYQAYAEFFKKWRGPKSQVAETVKRVEEIRNRLSGTTP